MRTKYFLILMLLCIMPTLTFGQAKKPTIMVVPAQPWCEKHGYMMRADVQGESLNVPDYERAIQQDMELYNVMTKIGELMSDREFPVKDLSSSVRNLRQNAAEDEMTTSRSSGSTLAESPLDRLLARAKADILVEVMWDINETGPKRSVTYTLKGIDAYTQKQVAAASGTGNPSFTGETPILLEEAVIDKMDNFTTQLQNHFQDMKDNGREIILTVRIFDNGSGLCFEDEYDGEELTDIIDNWMSQNTVKHRYSIEDATENIIHFEQVRIPLYRENGTAADARWFSGQLRKFLQKPPYNLTSKILTKGLGRADLILGEK